MGRLILLTIPVQHKISMLRDKETSTKDFASSSRSLQLMAYEVTRDLPLKEIGEIETPICKARTNVIRAAP